MKKLEDLTDAEIVAFVRGLPDHHEVTFSEEDWFMHHPFACRIFDPTFRTCEYVGAIREIVDDVECGTYIVTDIAEGLPSLERVP